MDEAREIEAKRLARRAAMPITTAFVEQFAEFKPMLIWACENGKTYGNPPADIGARPKESP